MIRTLALASALVFTTAAGTPTPSAATVVQIGTAYSDAHYGGLSVALNVFYQGDCDAAGYKVPMPNTVRAWAQIVSSFTGSPGMPGCNAVKLHAWRGPKKGQFWTGPLPVDHLGDWNDSIDYAQFYHR